MKEENLLDIKEFVKSVYIKDENLMLSSVHRSKGFEYKVVIYLNDFNR